MSQGLSRCRGRNASHGDDANVAHQYTPRVPSLTWPGCREVPLSPFGGESFDSIQRVRYLAMTCNQYGVYILDDSFDIRDTHTLDFIQKYHHEVCLLTQTADPPPQVATKGKFQTFDYPCIAASREMWLCLAGLEPSSLARSPGHLQIRRRAQTSHALHNATCSSLDMLVGRDVSSPALPRSRLPTSKHLYSLPKALPSKTPRCGRASQECIESVLISRLPRHLRLTKHLSRFALISSSSSSPGRAGCL